MSPAMFLEPLDKAACHHPGALGCKQKCLCYMGPDRCLDEAPSPSPDILCQCFPAAALTDDSGHQRTRAYDRHPTPQCSVSGCPAGVGPSHPFPAKNLCLAHAPSYFSGTAQQWPCTKQQRRKNSREWKSRSVPTGLRNRTQTL